MPERRREKRRHILYYLKLFDIKTGRMLGQLADITTSGLNMVSQVPVDAGRRFQLRMMLPEEISGCTAIFFEAECLWCRPDVNPTLHSIGFEFINVSPETINIIKNLINYFSFLD